MKRIVLAVAVVVGFTAGSAMANVCDFHQWKPCYSAGAKGNLVSGIGNLCHYHQWRKGRCKEQPVAKASPEPAPVQEKIVLEGVYFDTGSAKIKPESYPVLDSNVAKLKKKSDQHVTVVGYTDNVGKEASNIKLSEARAASVKAYMVEKGIDAGRISSKGMGPANPIADNKAKEGRAKNRRIEIEMK